MPFLSDSLIYFISFVGTFGTGLITGISSAIERTSWNQESKEEEIINIHKNINKNLNTLVNLQLENNSSITSNE
tara:strand:+ start:85 stop:306 length:222 start_codon:yes stop_codon:yes gene_type:complete